MKIKVNNKLTFSYVSEPLIIAEISSNHGGSKSKFLKLIKLACENGADLIKIQTYEPRDITLDKNYGNFKIKKGIWKGETLWSLYNKSYTPFSWHKDAFEIAKKYKKTLFSSPFSTRAVDFLENLNCKIYKIASFEITDLKLINYVASKKKPIIISTGMASIQEIITAINEIKKYHSKIIILHCISSYPTSLRKVNLQRIEYLKKIFPKHLIGLSDHTDNIYSSIASSAYGIVAIEKHFKSSKWAKTEDSKFSITPKQLNSLKQITSELHLSKKAKTINDDKKSKIFRRSLFAKRNIFKNEKFSEDNIDSKRPMIGLCASNYFKLIGKRATKKIIAGDPIKSIHLKDNF